MKKSFMDIVQNSPRTSLGIPVKSKNPLSRTMLPLAGPPFGFKLHKRHKDSSPHRRGSPART